MLSTIQRDSIKSWASKFFSQDNKAIDIFDINAEIDSSLSVEENKSILRKKIEDQLNRFKMENVENLKKKEAQIISKDEYKTMLNTEIAKVEKQAQLEFERCLDKIESDKTTEVIEDIYYIPKQYTKMVACGNARGFLLYGSCGTGKSYAVKRAFIEAGKKFVVITGHITSMELYKFLFNHRTENIIFDDVNILENKNNLNMLKGCLDDNSRIVSYHSSTSKLYIPNSFLFEGSIILLINAKVDNEDLKAVESRILNYELIMDYKTIMKVMFELARQEYKGITKEERFEIVNWIKNNTSQATKDFNLRSLFKIYEMFLFDKQNWKTLAGKTFIQDERTELILTGIAERDFCERFGTHRATYYRIKSKIYS